MRRIVLVLSAFAVLSLSVLSARAAVVGVTIAGFQYVGGGWVSATPLTASPNASAKLDGAPVVAPPILKRGIDSLLFTNRDALPHTVTKLSGPAGTWAALSLTGAGATSSLAIPALFPTGEYVYFCTLHQGMRGSFVVIA